MPLSTSILNTNNYPCLPQVDDYPQYASVPATSFQCVEQKYSGYFADPEAQCQVFHICLNTQLLGSFLCPNGTLFHQQLFVCDWWYNVRCDDATLSYDLNRFIGAQDQQGFLDTSLESSEKLGFGRQIIISTEDLNESLLPSLDYDNDYNK